MRKKINHYENNSLSVTPDNIHLHISMLFDKSAILLVKSQEEHAKKDFESFNDTIQKVIKIFTGLLGILDPNNSDDIKKAHTNPNEVQLKPNPWNNYFIAAFKTLNDITIKGDKEKLEILVKSLKDVAELWRKSKKDVAKVNQSQHLSPSLELSLNC